MRASATQEKFGGIFLQNKGDFSGIKGFGRQAGLFLALCAMVCHTGMFSVGATGDMGDGAVDEDTKYVYPIGKTVGIKLFSKGVVVIGLSEIPTEEGTVSPALDCGLEVGDIITHINQEEVNSIEDVQAILTSLEGDEMSLRYVHDDVQSQATIQAVQCSTDGTYKLGAWIRDSMAGIGTMSFYDPETNIFGTLGHGINDTDTAQLMPLETGSIMSSTVADVKKGTAGAAGELHGSFDLTSNLGEIYANTVSGVFGYLEDDSILEGAQLYPVAKGEEVTLGAATVLCNVEGSLVEEFDVEIIKLYPDAQDSRDFMLKITDGDLITVSGGIVQGMSGSPIIQDGKIIGAVTHVYVCP